MQENKKKAYPRPLPKRKGEKKAYPQPLPKGKGEKKEKGKGSEK